MIRANVWPLPDEDETMIREHHLADFGYERCVICRLLATIDAIRDEGRAEAAVVQEVREHLERCGPPGTDFDYDHIRLRELLHKIDEPKR